jgi:hypothetical protein
MNKYVKSNVIVFIILIVEFLLFHSYVISALEKWNSSMRKP